MSSRINYATIKGYAKQDGVKITDLIALAPQNDPFYMGTPTDIQLGTWFADLWQRFGYTQGVHIRRVHYQIVSQSPVVQLPNGTPYENTEACWDSLNIAAKAARYLGYVAAEAFVDRRNPEAVINTRFYDDPAPTVQVEEPYQCELELPAFPSLPAYQLADFGATQRYHLEVWCEKSTMNDVLLPLCAQYRANLQTGLGELSITATLAAVERIRASDRPARIFYVSDFDPAGQSMPVAVARKLEYFVRMFGDIDVKLLPVVLTADQVQQYRLPRTPIKASEKRAAHFEQRYGVGAVELDALEALYPGELRRILEIQLSRYYDHDLWQRTEDTRIQIEARLERTRQRILRKYQAETTILEVRYATIRHKFAAEIAEHNAEVSRVWQAISTALALNTPDISDIPAPVADEAHERDDSLYDSERDYFKQLVSYKNFQGKPSDYEGSAL
jgi:hypothetical protein